MTAAQNESAHEFKILREFDAPRDLIYKMWTEPKHLEQWWGPIGMKLTVRKLELRAGGEFHYEMESGTGNKMWGKFVYEEIVPPERIIFVSSFADESGNVIRAPFPGITWPLEWTTELTFAERNCKTLMTLKSWPLKANEVEIAVFVDGFKSMQGGFGATFDQLDKYLLKIKTGQAL